MAAAYVLTFNDRVGIAWLGRRFVPESARLGGIGVAVTVAGMGMAIWARRHLGQNCSATGTVKEDHELIRSGSYRRIRHPIYTGMLVGLAGTTAALGEYRGLLSPGIALATFFTKARKEERYLRAEFGPPFEEHTRQTGRFLPRLTEKAGS